MTTVINKVYIGRLHENFYLVCGESAGEIFSGGGMSKFLATGGWNSPPISPVGKTLGTLGKVSKTGKR